jgi:N-acetylglucosaminyl-diphospho-decaprenol L-rhamnosyltransferase
VSAGSETDVGTTVSGPPGRLSDGICVVIVNWNSGPLLGTCVASLAAARRGGAPLARVVVVDNGSGDGSADVQMPPGLVVEVIRNATNSGFAAGCNQGAERSQEPLLLFLNPDVEVTAASFAGLDGFLVPAAPFGAGILTIQLTGPDGKVQRCCARRPSAAVMVGQAFGLDRLLPRLCPPLLMTEWDHGETRLVDQVIGAFMLMRTADFRALGGFDPQFFLYMDEVDLSARAADAGLPSLYVHDRTARHIGGGTTNQIRDIRLAYILRSKVLYARKHFGAFGGRVVAAALLIGEPVVRLARAVVTARPQEAREVVTAVRMLAARYPFKSAAQIGEIQRR